MAKSETERHWEERWDCNQEIKLTFLLFGLLVANREADRDSSMEDVAVSITAMIQKRSEGLAALIQQERLLKVHQVLPTRLVVTTQNMLHQRLLLKDTKGGEWVMTRITHLDVSDVARWLK